MVKIGIIGSIGITLIIGTIGISRAARWVVRLFLFIVYPIIRRLSNVSIIFNILDSVPFVWYVDSMEQWKDIPGYVGLYQVSSYGRVRSLDRVVKGPRGEPKQLRGRVLSQSCDNKGYRTVGLSLLGRVKTKRVHQLVASAFIGPAPDGQEVRHGPDGVSDNSVPNLCYGTSQQNHLDRRRDGTDCGRAVRRGDGVEFPSMPIAAEHSNCCRSAIWDACNGRSKTAGGFSWEYV